MFWDVGKSRDEVSEIENFVRKKEDKHNNGARKKERKENKRMQQSPNSLHKNQRLSGNLRLQIK